MSVQVRIPSPLRRVTGGKSMAEVNATTLSACLDDLEKQFPGIKERLCDSKGQIQHFVNIYVNGEDVRFLQDLNTPLKSGDEVSIVPAIAGGSPIVPRASALGIWFLYLCPRLLRNGVYSVPRVSQSGQSEVLEKPPMFTA